MVKIALDAAVKVTAGPTLQLGSKLEPDSYSVAQLSLEAKDNAENKDEFELALLPEASSVVLLGVRARNAEDGEPAIVTMTPKNATSTGGPVTVDGALIVASRDVLMAIVADGGPRTLVLANPGAKPILVDVVAALDA